MASARRSRIYVIAGVNGAGKSSIGGAAFRELGADYYNPDEAARGMLGRNPALSQGDANSAAWHQGVRLLRRAIARKDFAFETTLGANTIPRMLQEAAAQGYRDFCLVRGTRQCPVTYRPSSCPGAPRKSRHRPRSNRAPLRAKPNQPD